MPIDIRRGLGAALVLLMLTVAHTAGSQTASLSETGATAVSLSLSSVNFRLQALNTTSAPQAVTLTNNQGSSISGIAMSITGTNSSDFSQTNNCGTSLASNSSCTINVGFTPSGYGARNATLSVTGSAGTQTSSLAGITPPSTQISSPANNLTVSGTVTVTAAATDTLGIGSIQIYIDGALSASGTPSPLNYSWNTTTVSNGTHTIYSTGADPQGNVGTSPTLTVTVNNRTQQLIKNGDFETGTLVNWTATGVYLPVVVTGHPHTGIYSAQLGASAGTEPNGDSSLFQTITIPSSAKSATLTFWYWAASADTLANDYQEAQLQSTGGSRIVQIMKVCSNAHAWTKVTYNLLPYKGQTVRLYFNTHQNGNRHRTYMYVDDVAVAVQ